MQQLILGKVRRVDLSGNTVTSLNKGKRAVPFLQELPGLPPEPSGRRRGCLAFRAAACGGCREAAWLGFVAFLNAKCQTQGRGRGPADTQRAAPSGPRGAGGSGAPAAAGAARTACAAALPGPAILGSSAFAHGAGISANCK